MTDRTPPAPAGRGSHINPANRFQKLHVEPDFEHLEHDEEAVEGAERPRTEYLADDAQSIVTENDSPDVPFRYSLNPYRGCSHGCAYCYARPTHEYLGFSAGLDFETRVLVKHRAPELLREFLARPSWRGDPIAMSGVTDCYQPAERHFRLTRRCLEVALDARQPLGIVTKNALVLRDLDLLREMAALGLAHVTLSITSLKQSLSRVMEPRTSAPAARLRAIRELRAAGVPVGVLVAPVIPGLTDSETPAILAAAAEAGAQTAYYQLLRLPLTVQPVFLEWLQRTHPLQAKRVESMIRSTRGGELNCSEFGQRMNGAGQIAEQIAQVFRTFARKHGLDRDLPSPDRAEFRPPRLRSGQMRLF
jgi:DNA repair photolyase